MGQREIKGSIIQRPRKGGGISHQAMLKIPGGKAVVKTFDDGGTAKQFLELVAADIASHREAAAAKQRREMLAKAARSPQESQQMLLDARLKDVLKGYKATSLASENHRMAIPAILLQVGEATVRDVKKSWVQSFVNGMRARKTYAGKPYAYATIVRQMAVLRLAIHWQAEELEAEPPKLPFSTKLLPKNWEGKRERRLERGEERALVARLRQIDAPSMHQWRLLLRMALETGARLQELVGMKWSEIDPLGIGWTIPADREKTGKRRHVPFTAAALRALSILKRFSPGDPRVFHMLGGPESVSALFRRYSREAGLVDFRFHDLRHEAISRMVVRSPDIYSIMKIVGHSSPEMLDRYANLRAEELAKALNANAPSARRRL